MKIEKLGVRITDTPWTITITPPMEIGGEMCGIRFAGQDWTREATEQVRDALTAALAEYDVMTDAAAHGLAGVPMPPRPFFTVGQVLTGDEDLPIGTEVSDCEGDLWVMRSNGSLSLHQPEGSTPLRAIVRELSPVKIMSLP